MKMMEREIKFRGYVDKCDEDEQRWVYGDLCHEEINDGRMERPVICYYDEDVGWYSNHVYEDSVGQWTGVDDGHGNEIYEGDIIDTFILGKRDVCVVEWDEDALQYVLRSRDGFIWHTLGELVNFLMVPFCVVGNMFENKKMMEGGEG